jgi:hypothetical protein
MVPELQKKTFKTCVFSLSSPAPAIQKPQKIMGSLDWQHSSSHLTIFRPLTTRMTCFTSIFAFGGNPLGALFGTLCGCPEEQVEQFSSQL